MANITVTEQSSSNRSASLDARVILAFFAIYVLWGTTFLAIRIAVQEIPPLLAAGMRFFVAGVVLYGFMRLRGQPNPSKLQWRYLAAIGMVMFVVEYGPLFWAEKYIPSGITSVLAATIPLITIVLEMLVFRHQKFRWSLLGAASLGFGGIIVLLMPDRNQHLALFPCIAILIGGVGWCVGSILNRSLPLPESRPLTSGATMMLGGGGLLVLSAAFGELHPLPHVSMRAALAVLYLIVFGSLLAFTAFVWLLGRMPASRVSSYAYVNPIVAVALGYFLAGEIITVRMFIGAAIVVLSVFLILRTNEPVKA